MFKGTKAVYLKPETHDHEHIYFTDKYFYRRGVMFSFKFNILYILIYWQK